MRLVVKRHDPRRSRLAAVLVTLLAAGAAWGLYAYGYHRAGYDNAALRAEGARLRQGLAALEEENGRLKQRVTALERAGQIDRAACEEVRRSLTALQDEMLELKEEVTFYRGIVAPAETARGLNITRFQVEPIGGPGASRFKLVLTQVKQNDRLIRGRARLTVEGVQDGKQRSLDLRQLTGGRLTDLKLRFRYFQNIEGEMVLPQGFVPSRVLVDILPQGRGLTRLKKPYDWTDVLS